MKLVRYLVLGLIIAMVGIACGGGDTASALKMYKINNILYLIQILGYLPFVSFRPFISFNK